MKPMVQALTAHGGWISTLIAGFTKTWGFPAVMLIILPDEGDQPPTPSMESSCRLSMKR